MIAGKAPSQHLAPGYVRHLPGRKIIRPVDLPSSMYGGPAVDTAFTSLAEVRRRPRIMIVGLRLEDARRLLPDVTLEHLSSLRLARWSSSRPEPRPQSTFDVPSAEEELLTPVAFLDPRRPTVSDAIDDLCSHAPRPSDFVQRLNQTLVPPAGADPHGPGNGNLRHHSDRTSLRFRLHLALARHGVKGDIFAVAARLERDEARHRVLQYLRRLSVPTPIRFDDVPITDPDTGADLGRDLATLADSIVRLATLKHSQRALVGSLPSPTILSLPDDFVHHREPRTLSVREMARLQSFPDTFRFYAKETTGGQSRKTDVPQYTQVGNAVPPWMAYRVGLRLHELLVQSADRTLDEHADAEGPRPGPAVEAVMAQALGSGSDS